MSELAPAPWFLTASAYVAVMFLTVAGGIVLVLGHREKMETGMWVGVLAVLVPASLALSRRQLLHVGETAAEAFALVNVCAVALIVVLARCAAAVTGMRSVATVLALGGIAVCTANALVSTTTEVVGSRRNRQMLEIVTLVLVAGALLSFFPRTFFSPARIYLCLVAAAGLYALNLGRRATNPGRRTRRALDITVLLITVLLVPDIRRYGDQFRYDYDYFLGPANAITHGHAMLVETFSQYGVGMPVALAGVFRAVPLSYGGLQAVLCVGYAIEFTLVYCILRLACRSQMIAVVGLLIAIVANLVLPGYSRMASPSVGPIRFALPWVIVFIGVLAAHSGNRRRSYDAALLCVLAIAAIWSFETFVYSAGTYLALVAITCATDEGPRRERIRASVGAVIVAVLVCSVSLVAFTLLTRLLANAWPDWVTYLRLVGLYSVREFGTLLFPPWSPGYVIAGTYVFSIIALAVVLLTRSPKAPQRATLTAISCATAYGALSFSYFLGRSHPTNLHHVAIPAVVMACCWVDLLQATSSASRRVVCVIGAVLVVGASSVVLTHNVAWTWEALRGSPLAQALHSPTTVASEIRDLSSREPQRRMVSESSRLLTRYHRTGRPVAVLLGPNTLTSTLLASGVGNALPIVNGGQDRLFGERALELVRRSVARMPSPAYALTEEYFLQRAPGSFAGVDPAAAGSTVQQRLDAAMHYGDYFIALAVAEVRTRFSTRVVARASDGLVVVELRRRTPPPRRGPS